MTFTDMYPQESLNEIADVELVDTAGDLPAPTNGTRSLADNTLYIFTDIVQDDTARLDAGDNSVLSGFWPSKSGYITTTGGPALSSSGVPVFVDRMFLYAPGGQLFDLAADATTELYLNKVTATDPTGGAGVNIADLGTIDGFRVPTFEGCNFEHFDAGFTFTGTSQKIAFKFCPFRNVPSGVTCIGLDAAANTDILKVDGAYFKDFADATTECVRVDPSATVSNITKYAGVDHDTTVAQESILNGQIGRREVGTLVLDSYPLADSTVFGSIKWSGSQVIAGSGTAPTEIVVPTTEYDTNERVDSPSDGVLRYIGLPNENARPTATVRITGVNSTVELRFGLNGTVLAQPPVVTELPSTAATATVTVIASVQLTTNDELSVFVENVDGTNDVTVESMTVNI